MKHHLCFLVSPPPFISFGAPLPWCVPPCRRRPRWPQRAAVRVCPAPVPMLVLIPPYSFLDRELPDFVHPAEPVNSSNIQMAAAAVNPSCRLPACARPFSAPRSDHRHRSGRSRALVVQAGARAPVFAGLDYGTSGARLCLIDKDERIQFEHSCGYDAHKDLDEAWERCRCCRPPAAPADSSSSRACARPTHP